MNSKRYLLSPESRKSYEMLPVPLCVYKLVDGVYQLVLVSDGMCEMLNTPREELLGNLSQNLESLAHPDDVYALRDARAYAMLHPEVEYHTVSRLLKKPNTYIWVSCYGKIQSTTEGEEFLFAEYADVTDRELLRINIEIERKQRELLFREILNATQTALFWKDSDRRFLGVNKAFLDYYDFPDESVLIGKNDEDMGWHADPDPYKNDELQVLQTGKSTYRVPGECLSHGENRNIVASKSPLYVDGKITGLVGSFEDVTIEYKQREQIIQLNKQLKQEAKKATAANEAKSEFLSRISHDMRTPLNVVIGMAHIASEEKNSERTKDCLEKIDASSHFLLGLINDVLDMAKAERGKIELHVEPYQVEEFYGYIDAVVRPLCVQKKLNLVFDPQLVKEYIPLMDKLRSNQILFNLLSNAVKFTPEGGTVTVGIHEELIADKKMRMKIMVSDTGCGMSESFQKKLFEPFTQEQRDDVSLSRGTGLGLSIVKQMTDLMHGTIQVDSKVGKGTTFTISGVIDCIPVESFKEKVKEKKNYEVLSGKRVLLCEDHPLNQEIARELLEKKGMIVEIADNGEQGVEKFGRPCNKVCVNGHKDILFRRSNYGQQKTERKG
jgi:PAS domain S-box-containing protein